MDFYSAKIYEWIMPKWGRISLSVGRSGSLLLDAAPSKTPGEFPPGVKAGKVPKGVKMMNYDNKIITTIEANDIMQIRDFYNLKNLEDSRVIMRNNNLFKKGVSFNWVKSGDVAKVCNIYFNSEEKDKKINFKIPVSLNILNEILVIMESYLHNITMIRLYCQSQFEKLERTNKSFNKPNNEKIKINDDVDIEEDDFDPQF